VLEDAAIGSAERLGEVPDAALGVEVVDQDAPP